MENNSIDVLIVGAGMAGLMAARACEQKGMRCLVVDKGLGVGGRLSTRRIGPGLGDLGAQFFTVRTPEFQALVDNWVNEELVYEWSSEWSSVWSSGWSEGSLATTAPTGHPRFAVRGGMNSLAMRMAQGLQVRTNTPLLAIHSDGRGWLARDQTGKSYTSRALILTPPAPRSLELLDAGQVILAPHDRMALERIAFAPCLAGLLWVIGAVRLPDPGAVQRPDAPVSWIADNQRKGISKDAAAVTLHAGAELSRQLWDAPDGEVLDEFRRVLKPYLDSTAAVAESHIWRWRHAVATTLHPERYLLAAGLAPLVFAGDGFRWPYVEGAALSGIAAANAIIRRLQ